MKPHTKLIIASVIALLLGGALLSGCSGAKVLEGAKRDAVLGYSEPAADNLFEGMNANDYAAFAADFDEKLASAMTETQFAQIQTGVLGKIGKYVSREIDRVEEQDKFIAVVYKAKFEQEDEVAVRLVFNNDDAHQISGLWFDSPKLREK